jgi:hypothetical protein
MNMIYLYIGLALLLFVIIGIVIYTMVGKSSPPPFDDAVYKNLQGELENKYARVLAYMDTYKTDIRKIAEEMKKFNTPWEHYQDPSAWANYTPDLHRILSNAIEVVFDHAKGILDRLDQIPAEFNDFADHIQAMREYGNRGGKYIQPACVSEFTEINKERAGDRDYFKEVIASIANVIATFPAMGSKQPPPGITAPQLESINTLVKKFNELIAHMRV